MPGRPIHLLFPCPPAHVGQHPWGDYYFGQSLAAALEALGHPVTIQFQYQSRKLKRRIAARWRNFLNPPPKNAVELLLTGLPIAARKTHRPRITWLFSHSDSLDREAASELDHLFVASTRFTDKLQADGIACETLLQCTDQSRFHPNRRSDEAKSNLLFVGNRSDTSPRPVVSSARDAGFDVTVWGSNWDGIVDGITFRGTHISNEALGAHYASADVVLNDHRQAMLQDHFISNRVYDVLASGRPVVTEAMDGLPAELSPGVFTYTEKSDLVEAIEHAKQADSSLLADVSRIVRANHSFDNRASTISQRVASL